MDHFAIGLDRGSDDRAVFVGVLGGVLGGSAAVFDGLLPRRSGIMNGKGDVFDTIAKKFDMARGGVVFGQAAGEDEADVALGEVVVSGFAAAGGLITHLLAGEAETVAVEVSSLLGVAAIEANVVDIDECEGVGGEGGDGGGLGGDGGHGGFSEVKQGKESQQAVPQVGFQRTDGSGKMVVRAAREVRSVKLGAEGSGLVRQFFHFEELGKRKTLCKLPLRWWSGQGAGTPVPERSILRILKWGA